MISRITNRLFWEVRQLPVIRQSLAKSEVAAWLASGKVGATPHCVKQANLRRLARQLEVLTLVETGTFRADMMCAMRNSFAELYSIELSEQLYEYSKTRCKTFGNIHLLHGDSAVQLPLICGKLQGRALFWLDGHYSGGDTALGDVVSPIIGELNAIRSFQQIEPIIVIDDARLFAVGTGYPTLSQLFDCVAESGESFFSISIHDDAIVCIPRHLLLRINSSAGQQAI